MGLFRKKTDDAEQLAVLRSEIVSLRERLDVTDQDKAELRDKVDSADQTSAALRQRVDTVDQTNAVLYQRVDSLDSASASLGQQVGELGTSTTDLTARVGAVDAAVGKVRDGVADVNVQADTVGTLGAQVQSLAERLDAVPPRAPLPAPDNRIDVLMQKFAALSESVAEQNDAAGDAAPGVDADDIATIRSEMSQMVERMATLDHRMTSVSTELANQLTELSNDLEVLLEAKDDDTGNTQSDAAANDSAAVTLAIEAVQTSTERLANEQARYQIQFREDLAELAERLRRPNR